ncbi:mono/diheme cytochrome c family protein [Oxalobacteraceae bacterium GrIS 1.11]
MHKRTFFGLLGLLVIIAALGVYGWFWRPALAPIAPPAAAAFSPQLVAKGAMLAGIGNCAACHTVKGGAPLAGGLGLATPFGTIYSTNLTPDPDTGIGRWSPQAFKRAMREGVRRDGAHLFPVFPYTHFNLVNDEDLTALYAYCMTRPAVSAPAKQNTVPFPLSVRAMQAGWKLLYFRPAQYDTGLAKSVDWNRGRYLAEGLAHCAACHTPRNSLGAERSAAAYLGAPIDGWFAPALTAANTAPLPWTESELYAFLRSGASTLHGAATGPMAAVVHQGLSLAPDVDVHALATYFADLDGAAAPQPAADLAALMARSAQVRGQYNDRGAALYLAACASCHSNSDGKPAALRPELGLNSALTAAAPVNLVQVILHGVGRGRPGALMPGFAGALSDVDIAQVAAYLRRSRTTLPPWSDLDASIAEARRNSQP